MKKLLCTIISAVMIFASAAEVSYADEDIYGSDSAKVILTAEQPQDNDDIELMSMPIEGITDSGLSPEAIEAINNAAAEALAKQDEHIVENDGTRYLEIVIPEEYTVNVSDEQGNISDEMNAAWGIVENIISDDPTYFYFGNRYSYRTFENNLYSFLLPYFYSADEIVRIQEQIDNKVAEIKAAMESDGINADGKSGDEGYTEQDDFDKALWLHDYIINNIKYDWRAEGGEEDQAMVKRTLDAGLLDGLTVCQGYSLSYKYLLSKVNVDCINVYSNTEQHEWSAVKIGGGWYYVDTTQDDNDILGKVSHEYFLVNDEELLQGGTHKDGFITDKGFGEVNIGSEYANKSWHGHYEEIIIPPQEGEGGEESGGDGGEQGGEESGGDGGEQGPDTGETQPPEPQIYRIWSSGDVNTPVIFDGNNRYYVDIVPVQAGNDEAYTAIFKLGANLENKTEYCKIPDGIWIGRTKNGFSFPRHDGYYGGIGKYIYSESGEKYLYFNSQTDIYRIELGGTPIVESIYHMDRMEIELTPDSDGRERYGVKGIHGISVVGSILKYELNTTISTKYEGNTYGIDFGTPEQQELLALETRVVTFMDGDKKADELYVPYNYPVIIPEYYKYGHVITGWTADEAGETAWDFNTPITEDMTLYVKTANAGWHRSGTMSPTGDLLIGTLTMGVNGFDPKYQEAPSYILAVYENDVLTAVRESADGTFNLTAEDNVVYNDGTTTVKAYAWNDSKLIPYLDPMNITFRSNPSGEGGSEGPGDSEVGEGGGEDSGESGESGGENTEGETGDVTPGQE